MRPRLSAALAALALALFAGCTELPALPDEISDNRADLSYLELVPAGEITSQVPPPRSDERTAPDLQSRADRLRARAARLDAPVIDAETQERMQTGVTR
jgi:hypothetical protein